MSKCDRENIKNGNQYAINGHGTMLTNEKDEAYVFRIPENINIYTFVKLEDRLLCTKDIQYNTCNINQPEDKKSIPMLHKSPAFRYSKCIFPNILFYSDDVSPQKTFYSGIVHCATNCVIHNIDLHESLGCDCDKVRPTVKPPSSSSSSLLKYDCNKNNYSSNTSCGTIFLKDAIEKIQQFVSPDKEIDIFILTCIEKQSIEQFSKYIERQHRQFQTFAGVFGSIHDKIRPLIGSGPENPNLEFNQTYCSPDIYPNRYEFIYNNKKIILVFSDTERQENILVSFLRFMKQQILLNNREIGDLLEQYSKIDSSSLEINLQSFDLANHSLFHDIFETITEKLQEYITALSLLSLSSVSPSKSHSRKIPQKPKLKRHLSVIGSKSPVVPLSQKRTLFRSKSTLTGGRKHQTKKKTKIK